jgi:phosphoribosyl-AMP cyclohydrolase
MESLEKSVLLDIQYAKRGGLIPAVAQDYVTGEVLMLAYINQQALEETIRSGYATFWKTSGKQGIWTKGMTSGDKLLVKEILVDCDQDALIYKVEREGGGACHTKSDDGRYRRSCFYRRLNSARLDFIE